MWFLISGSGLGMGSTAVEHDGRQGLHSQNENHRPPESFRESPDRHGQDSVPPFYKTDRKNEDNERQPERAEARQKRLVGNLAFPFVEGSTFEVAPAGRRDCGQR